MIKLANKRMAIAWLAAGHRVYIENKVKDYDAGWFHMNDNGEIIDERGVKYVSEDFSADMDEYFALEPSEERK